MFRKAVLVAFTVFVLCANTVLAEDIQIDKIKAALRCTVLINGNKVNQGTIVGNKDSAISYKGVGAGVIVDPRGYVLTNYHVIEGIQELQVRTYDGKEYIGQYVSHDPTTDIALIKITPIDTLVPITIGDSSTIDLLDRVAITGHPFGLDYSTNSGEISGLGRELLVKENLRYFNLIQVCAAVNPGNSGGPLFNAHGEMIGIVSALRLESNLIAFAIPADFVMEVGAELLNRYTSKSCYHGIHFKEIDVNRIGTPNINVDDYKILAVDSVDPDSPAAKAGLQPGDILLDADNLHLDRKLDLYRSLVDKKDGDTVRLVLERDGSQYEASLALKASQSSFGNRGNIVANMGRASKGQVNVNTSKPSVSAFSQAARMENAVGDYVWKSFGLRGEAVPQDEFSRRTKNMDLRLDFAGAVQITEVRPGSIFEDLQIEKGDMLAGMITGTNAWNITRITDLKYLAERWSPEELGSEVTVIVIRNQGQFAGRLPVKSNLATSGKSSTVR